MEEQGYEHGRYREQINYPALLVKRIDEIYTSLDFDSPQGVSNAKNQFELLYTMLPQRVRDATRDEINKIAIAANEAIKRADYKRNRRVGYCIPVEEAKIEKAALKDMLSIVISRMEQEELLLKTTRGIDHGGY